MRYPNIVLFRDGNSWEAQVFVAPGDGLTPFCSDDPVGLVRTLLRHCQGRFGPLPEEQSGMAFQSQFELPPDSGPQAGDLGG